MGAFVSTVAALFITLPILLYTIVFFAAKQWTKNSRRSMNAAINITTPLLIFSVHFLIIAIWSSSHIWGIMLFMLILGVVFTFIYWKSRDEIYYPKLFLGYWRLNFLVFSAAYIVLLVYGTTSRAIEAVTSG